MVSIGKQAPDFALANDAGEKARLSDFRGRLGFRVILGPLDAAA